MNGKTPLFWPSNFGKVLHYLKSQKFVNILSEPRTGSTALYESLRREQEIDLDEITSKSNFDNTLSWIESHTDQCKVMKNHCFEILEKTKEQQDRFFNLKAFHVGLSRRNLFEQSCSLARAELTNNYHNPNNRNVIIDVDFYTDIFWKVIYNKFDLCRLYDRLDMILFYEDIAFAKSQKHRKFPKKTDIIENIDQLRDRYSHLIKMVSLYPDLVILDK